MNQTTSNILLYNLRLPHGLHGHHGRNGLGGHGDHGGHVGHGGHDRKGQDMTKLSF